MKKTRLLSMLLCLSLVMALFTGFSGTASADDVITHTVVNGDYLFKVCKSYGLDYYQCKQAIMALNGFTSEQQLNRISVGQQIKLPASNAIAATVKASTTTTTTVTTATTVAGVTTTTSSTSTVVGTPAAAGYNVEFYLVPHKIASGETLNSICNALGTSYYQYSSIINAANGISNVNNIKAGDLIYVPTNIAPSSGSFYGVVAHKVASGETVTSICSKYGTNYETGTNKKLVNGLNSSVNLNRIYVGQKILIPVTGSYSSSTATVPAATAAPAAPGAKVYQLSFNNPANGDPSATVGSNTNATRASAGQTVEIKANADSGYALASVKAVRTDSGSNLKINNNTFVMPESDVAITVTYAKGLTLKKLTCANGTFDTYVGGTAGTSAFYGNLVTLVLNPNDNYVLDKATYQKADGSLAAIEIKDDDKDGFYTFYMPNYNVKISVKYKLASFHKLSIDKVGQGTVDFIVNEKTVNKAAEGETVVVKIKPAANYIIKRDFDIKTENSALSELKKIDETTYSFKMGTADTVFKIQFENAKVYSLTAASVTGGWIRFNVTDSVTNKTSLDAKSAKEGDIVEVIVSEEKNSFDSSKGIEVTFTDSTSKVCANLTAAPYKFTMPGANVTAKANFTSTAVTKYYLYKETDNHGTFTCLVGSAVETSEVASGETVSLKISPDPNYSIDTIVINNASNNNLYSSVTGNNTISYDASLNTFTMPATGVKIYITFKQDIQYVEFSSSISPASVAIGRFVINNQEITSTPVNAAVGSTFGFQVNITDDKYEVDSVTVDGKELTPNAAGYYPYTVKESDYTTHAFGSGNPLEFKATLKVKETKTYDVIYSDPVNGEYWIVVDGTPYDAVSCKAPAEATVKLVIYKADINTGYELNKVSIGTNEISAADLTDEGTAYTYSFIMPADNVITKVTYKEKP